MYIFHGDYTGRDRLLAAFENIHGNLSSIIKHYHSNEDAAEEEVFVAFMEDAVDALDVAVGTDEDTLRKTISKRAGAFYEGVMGKNTPIQFIWPSHAQGIDKEYLNKTYLSITRQDPVNLSQMQNILVDISDNIDAVYVDELGQEDASMFYNDIVAHTTFTVGYIQANDEGVIDEAATMVPPVAWVRDNGTDGPLLLNARVREAFTHLAFSMAEYQQQLEEDRYTPFHRFATATDMAMSTIARVMYHTHDNVDIVLKEARATADAITGLHVEVEETPEYSEETPYVPVRVALWYGNEYVVLTVVGASPDSLEELIRDVLCLPVKRIASLEENTGPKVTEDTASVPVGLALYPDNAVPAWVFDGRQDVELLNHFMEEVDFPKVVSVSSLTLSELDRMREVYTDPPHLQKAVNALYERLESALDDIADTQF